MHRAEGMHIVPEGCKEFYNIILLEDNCVYRAILNGGAIARWVAVCTSAYAGV